MESKSNSIIQTGNNLILLIKGLLNNQEVELTDPSFASIYKLAKGHSIENLLFYALNKYKQTHQNVIVEPDVINGLIKDNKHQITVTAYQEAELDALKEELNQNKIRYSLMKGSIIKYLYPSTDMRSMGDLDLYFDSKYHKEIKNIFKELGYQTIKYNKDNHDEYVKEPFVHVEMHKEMMNEIFSISNYYKQFYKNDNFYNFERKTDNESDYECIQKEEDFYIFLIAHAGRHFSTGGTGIRTVIDQYLYLNAHKDELDFKYIKNELDKMNLSLFEENLTKLAYRWFGGVSFSDEENKILDDMSEYIFGSGTYGNASNNALNRFVGSQAMESLNQSRFKYIIRRLFPTYQAMVWRNPILKKWKILLPVFYITRLFRGAFTKGESSKSELNMAKNISDEEIQKNKDLHKNIGA